MTDCRYYVPAPQQPRNWDCKPEEKRVFLTNQRRVRGERGQRLLKRRGEFLERPFAYQYETGGLRRMHVRGLKEVTKLLQAAAFNLALILRSLGQAGTSRGWADAQSRSFTADLALSGGFTTSGSEPWANERQISQNSSFSSNNHGDRSHKHRI